MTPDTHVKHISITAVCTALCLILPMLFHTIPDASKVFCPMHIPVLLCGLVCGWTSGLFCGVAGPLLSSLFFGMPVMALLPGMMIELAAYGMITGLTARITHTGHYYTDTYISLITALLGGRILAGICNGLLFASPGYTIAIWAAAYFVKSFPGILIQLALIPPIAVSLKKARLIPTNDYKHRREG